MTGQGHFGAGATHWRARPSQSELVFLHKIITYRNTPQHPLRRSHRWRSRMWCSWAGVVPHGLWVWGRLDILPNYRKQCWRLLMVEKLTLKSLATALVDIPAVSMPIARSLKTWDICGIVLSDKTAHCRVVFYCPQHKVHLCNDHAV